MTTYFSDDFNRADDATTLGASWAALNGTWGVTGNKAYCATPATDAHNGAYQGIAQDDVTVSAYVTLSATTNRSTAGVRLRIFSNNTWVGVFLEKSSAANKVHILQNLGGNGSTLGTVNLSLVDGGTYLLRARISGGTIAAYVDDVLKISPVAFDASLTTQGYGIGSYVGSSDYDDGGSRWDDYIVDDWAPAPPASGLAPRGMRV